MRMLARLASLWRGAFHRATDGSGSRGGARRLFRRARRPEGGGRSRSRRSAARRAPRDGELPAAQARRARIVAGQRLGRRLPGRPTGVARPPRDAGAVASRRRHVRARDRIGFRDPRGGAGDAPHPRALPGPFAAGARLGRPHRGRASAGAPVRARARRLARAHHVLRGRGRDLGEQHHADSPGRAGVRAHRPRHRQLLPAAGRGSGRGPALRSRGRRRGPAHEHPLELGSLAAALRRRPGNRRPVDHGERRGRDRGARRAARRLSGCSSPTTRGSRTRSRPTSSSPSRSSKGRGVSGTCEWWDG